jgi:hypothetical protein
MANHLLQVLLLLLLLLQARQAFQGQVHHDRCWCVHYRCSRRGRDRSSDSRSSECARCMRIRLGEGSKSSRCLVAAADSIDIYCWCGTSFASSCSRGRERCCGCKHATHAAALWEQHSREAGSEQGAQGGCRGRNTCRPRFPREQPLLRGTDERLACVGLGSRACQLCAQRHRRRPSVEGAVVRRGAKIGWLLQSVDRRTYQASASVPIHTQC